MKFPLKTIRQNAFKFYSYIFIFYSLKNVTLFLDQTNKSNLITGIWIWKIILQIDETYIVHHLKLHFNCNRNFSQNINFLHNQ